MPPGGADALGQRGRASAPRPTRVRLNTHARQISCRLSEAGRKVDHFIDQGGPRNKEHWYYRQVIQTANNSRHWVNLNEPRFFVKLSFTPEESSRYPRLIFVVSLHHTGRQLTGIVAATAFALIEYYYDARSDHSEEEPESQLEDCTVRPFTFTWENDAESLSPRFRQWAEQCLAPAVAKWGEYLA